MRLRSLPLPQYDNCMDGGVQYLFGFRCSAPALHAGLPGAARRRDAKQRHIDSKKSMFALVVRRALTNRGRSSRLVATMLKLHAKEHAPGQPNIPHVNS